MAKLTSITATLFLSTLVACGSPQSRPPSDDDVRYQSGSGVVESIATVNQGGDSLGLGAVAGGVVGGVLGNQVGSGRGQTAATIAGAVGGAYAGHEIEKNRRNKVSYRLTVRMQNGNYQTVADDTGSFQIGDRVKISDNGKATLR